MLRRLALALLPLTWACGPDDPRLAADGGDADPDVAEVVVPPGGCVDELAYHERSDDRFDRRAELIRDARGRLVRYRETAGAADTLVADVALRWDDFDRLVAEDEDRDGDGALERTIEWLYDGEGRLAGVRSRSTVYESSTYDMTLFHDAAGRRLREETDRDLDGIADEVRRYEWTDGEPLGLALGTDDDGDGAVDSGWRHEFRDGRWCTLTESFHGGEVQARERFLLDAAGRLLRREFDFPVGGPVEYIDVYARDALGRIDRVDHLDGVEGRTYEFVLFERDAAGRLVRRTYVAPDPTYFSGVFVFDRDAAGRVAAMGQYAPDTDVPWVTWTVRRGCPGDPPLDVVRRAPIHDLSRYLHEEDFELDLREWWDPVGPW